MNQFTENLDQLRRKLIDLSGRNPLIKYNLNTRQPRHIDIIDQALDDLWVLFASGEELKLRFLPESKLITVKGEKASSSPIETIAKEYGFNPVLDLPISSNRRGRTKDLQTLLSFDRFLRLVSAIHETARLGEEEKGINTLYCVFGFLEWQESSDSDLFLSSPMLLIPIEMDPFKTKSVIEGSLLRGGEIELDNKVINPSLRLKLKHELDLDLPGWEEHDTPSSYFERVEAIIKVYPKWRIRSRVLIGNFAFPKLALYEDLEVSKWDDKGNNRLTSHPVLGQLLGGMDRHPNFEGREILDKDTIGKPIEGIVFDTDSSQLEAIRRIANGESIVLEGPPGTGKSQTIANLITVAMSQGKKVLFVADKKAAIEVVEKRLKNMGLVSFCLNLHDASRRGKEHMYSRLNERLELGIAIGTIETQSSPLWDTKLSETLCKTADKLDSYFFRLSNSANSSSLPIKDILWSSISTRHQFNEFPGLIRKTKIPNALSISVEQNAEINDLLTELERQVVQLDPDSRGLGSHPLFGLQITDPSIFKKEQIADQLAILAKIIKKLLVSVERIKPLLSSTDQTPIKLEMVHRLVENYGSNSDYLLQQALITHSNPESVIDVLKLFMEHCPKCNFIELNHGKAKSLLQATQALSDFLDCHDKDRITIEAVSAKKESITTFLSSLENICLVLLKLLPDLLPTESRDWSQLLKEYVEVLLKIQSLSDKARKYLNPTLWHQIAIGHWEALAKKANTVEELRQELNQVFSEEIFNVPEVVDHLAKTLKCSAVRFFKPAWWRARSDLARIVDNQISTNHADRLRYLDSLCQWQRLREEILADTDLIALVGAVDDPCRIDFESVLSAQKTLDEIFEAAPGLCRMLQKQGISAEQLLLQTIEILGHQAHATLLKTAEDIKTVYCEDSLEAIKDMAVRHERSVIKVLESAQILGLGSTMSRVVLNDLPDLLNSLDQLVIENSSFCGRTIQEIHDAFYLNYEIQRMVTDEIKTIFIEFMVSRDTHEREQLNTLILNLGRLLIDFKEAWTDLKVIAILNESAFLGQSMMSTEIQVIANRLTILNQEIDQLSDWAKIQRILVQFRKTDSPACDLLENFIEQNRPFVGISQSFSILFEQNRAREAYIEHEFSEMCGDDIQSLRRRFKREDSIWKDASVKYVKTVVLSQPIWGGSSTGPRREWTGLELIRNELAKNKRRISQRQLIVRAGQSLLSMTPCFMMSPVTVAQYLAPTSGLNFDIVLIDEASQMRPEEALSAIARGIQVVIVGDSQQLPPTNFYYGTTEDDQISDEDAIDNESILDMAKATFNSHNLRWHYRSRHDSLIHFSNVNFYNGRLIVCPSPQPISAIGGLHLLQVNGIYKNSCNDQEAEQIVAKAVELLQTYSKMSLGIVAINGTQRELISSLLYEARYRDPDLDACLDAWEEKGERCFVKNLENVQGDERDIILISTVYGPSQPGGHVLRHFGPINSSVGHRRLNVLFTRARYSMYVFTSLKPFDVCPADAGAPSRGALALSQFLEFAASGINAPSNIQAVYRKDPDSPFEQFVGDLMEQSGYEIEYQVGQSGFRIDIGVKHPSFPYGYIAGIECDGAAYHSSKSARDRDRLRQDILEAHGWNIYRIWSTDWFNNPQKEGQKLIKWLLNRRDEINNQINNS